MNNETKSLEEMMKPKTITRGNWSTFVESDIVNFFNLHKIEKMTVEDGNGNKAKLSRTKDDGIKVECSSISVL